MAVFPPPPNQSFLSPILKVISLVLRRGIINRSNRVRDSFFPFPVFYFPKNSPSRIWLRSLRGIMPYIHRDFKQGNEWIELRGVFPLLFSSSLNRTSESGGEFPLSNSSFISSANCQLSDGISNKETNQKGARLTNSDIPCLPDPHKNPTAPLI